MIEFKMTNDIILKGIRGVLYSIPFFMIAGIAYPFIDTSVIHPLLIKKEFQNARELEGKVVDEKFLPDPGGLFGRSDVYDMVVELPDGSRRVFEYWSGEARKSDMLYNKSDIVKFRDGFKPGDNF